MPGSQRSDPVCASGASRRIRRLRLRCGGRTHPLELQSCSAAVKTPFSRALVRVTAIGACLHQVRPKEDQEAILSCLSAEELAGTLDLRPFMQRHPFVVAADASMSRAYRLFRTMGLRHMFVGPPRPQVMLKCKKGPLRVDAPYNHASVPCHGSRPPAVRGAAG